MLTNVVLLVVTLFSPVVLPFGPDFGFYPPGLGFHSLHPGPGNDHHGPPSSGHGRGSGNRGKGNRGNGHGNGNGNGHGKGHGNGNGGGHGHGHGPPPFAHAGGNKGGGNQQNYEDYDYVYDFKDGTTARTRVTKGPHMSTTPKPKTTTDYSDLIDIRFGKGEDDRRKRSTKPADIPTAEPQLRGRYNFLDFHPGYHYWNAPDEDFKPFYHTKLTNCVEKKYECVTIDECKSPPRPGGPEGHPGFCRWVHDEPYVCCEKPKKEKFQNKEIKCGRMKTNEYSQAIVGGTAVEGGTGYPWMVAVGERSSNENVDWYCGGALIGEKTIITAAHCLSKRKADMIRVGSVDLKVRAGGAASDSSEAGSSVQELQICRTLMHPLYRSPLLYNDVALLYVEEPVRFSAAVKPICLPQRTSVAETPVALLTGWGQLGFALERSPILQEVTVNVFNNSYCDAQYAITPASKRNFPRGILDTQLCAGDAQGGKDACQGDSGAPLVTEENGSFVLIGLVSAGIGCGSQTFPGVYTRITSFAPWILENII